MKKLILFLGLFLFAFSSQAANITVNNSNDSGSGSLRAAITTANGNGQNDVITITATGTITLASGLPNLTSNITIAGPGSANLTIDGINTHQIFNVTSGNTVVISGMTLTKGGSNNLNYGGGLTNSGSTVTINDCVITNNTTAQWGGALYLENGTLTVNNSTLSSNTASTDGGVVYVWSQNTTATLNMNSCILDNNSARVGGGVASESNATSDIINITLLDCTISNNTSTHDVGTSGGSFGGGGVFSRHTLTMRNCTIIGNNAKTGGAGVQYEQGVTSFQTVEITNCTFTNNIRTKDEVDPGGGLHCHINSGNLLLTNCQFTGNQCNAGGGAIYLTVQNGTIDQCTFDNNHATGITDSDAGGAFHIKGSNTTLTIKNSTISNNTSQVDGGAMEIYQADVTIENTTISGNNAKRYGGAIDYYDNASPSNSLLILRNCTIVNNIGDSDNSSAIDPGGFGGGEGGGVAHSSGSNAAITIANTIIANNTMGNGAMEDLFTDGTVTSGEYNFIESREGTYISGTGDILNADPNLGTLQDNGGATLTHLPNAGSQVIDQIPSGSAPACDQRLAQRTGTKDIGAVEVGGAFSDITVAVSPSDVDEDSGSNMTFTFIRGAQSCSDLKVDFTITGSATFNTDYSQSGGLSFDGSNGSVIISAGSSSTTFTITPIDDGDTEGDETVIITIIAGGGYNLGGTNIATATITDDEAPPTPTITITTSQATQGESSNTAMIFTFSRGAQTSGALVVNFTVSGSADPTSDFSVSGHTSFNAVAKTGTITIADGQSTKQLMITPTSDSLVEGSETVTVTIAAF